jgi:hypothetical protein
MMATTVVRVNTKTVDASLFMAYLLIRVPDQN